MAQLQLRAREFLHSLEAVRRVFALLLGCRLVEPTRAGLTTRGALGSIVLAHTPAVPDRPARHRAANPAKAHPGAGAAMAEVKPEEGEPGAEGEEVARKEHDVSIVLSFMNDEHEKAAIEVRRGRRRRKRARSRRATGPSRPSSPRFSAREIHPSRSIWNPTRERHRDFHVLSPYFYRVSLPRSRLTRRPYVHATPHTFAGGLLCVRQAHAVQGRGAGDQEGLRL